MRDRLACVEVSAIGCSGYTVQQLESCALLLIVCDICRAKWMQAIRAAPFETSSVVSLFSQPISFDLSVPATTVHVVMPRCRETRLYCVGMDGCEGAKNTRPHLLLQASGGLHGRLAYSVRNTQAAYDRSIRTVSLCLTISGRPIMAQEDHIARPSPS